MIKKLLNRILITLICYGVRFIKQQPNFNNMNILLITPPVFMPTVMSYSLAMMNAVLTSSLKEEISVLDLNAIWHYNEFQDFYEKKEDYFSVLTEFVNKTRQIYPSISKDVLASKKPLGYDKIMQQILDKKPDVVAISLTYNSQIFFAKTIISELQEKGIKVVLGGPADYSKIMQGTTILPNFEKLVEHLVSLGANKQKNKFVLDYTLFDKKYYLTKDIIYPLRTAHSCPYQQCTFCTHHGDSKYECFDLNIIKDTIVKNKMKKVCFIDDDFTIGHLKELSKILKPLNVQWWCQLRPLKELITILPELYETGLRSVAWGVESGNQRVLNDIKKGTKVSEIEKVLETAKELGIKNILYVLFGFPTETEEEFMQTVEFLEKNTNNIDLISTSIFGLQQGSKVFSSPKQFGLKEIKLSPRTYLSDKVSYLSFGLSSEEVKKLKKKHSARINKINKIPKVIAACKEQVLNL